MHPAEKPLVKAQWIRLFDVFLLGPLMVAGGSALAKKNPGWGALLAGSGVATSLFNGANYVIVSQRERLLAQGRSWPGAAPGI